MLVAASGLFECSSAWASPPTQTLSGSAQSEGIEAQVSATMSAGKASGTLNTVAPSTLGGGLAPLSPAEVEAGAGTARVIVSADGANVYATDRGASQLSIYKREVNGTLGGAEVLSLQGMAVPEGIVESPDGKDVYVADFATDSVTELTRGPGGTLAEAGQVEAGMGPIGITLSPDGAFLYVANSKSSSGAGAVSVYARNLQEGTLTLIQEVPAEANAHDVVVSPDGKDAYVADYGTGNVSQYERHEDGTLTPLATPTVAAGGNPHGLAISPDGGSLYVADNELHGQVLLLARNHDGTLSPRGAAPAGEYTEDVAVSPDGDSVYATGFESDDISQFARNAETGALTSIAKATPTGANPEGVVVSPDGANVYVADSHGGLTGGVGQYARELTANGFEGTVECMLVGGRPGTGPVEVSVQASGSGWYEPGQGQAPIRLPGDYRQLLTTALHGGGDEFGLLAANGLPSQAQGASTCEAGSFAGLRPDTSSLPLRISTSIVEPTDGTLNYSGTVTLAGASEPGAVVSIYEGSTLLATSAPAGSDGEWSQTLNGLAVGLHVFLAHDVGDGTAPSNTVALDVRAPVAPEPAPIPAAPAPAHGVLAEMSTYPSPLPATAAQPTPTTGVARLLGQGIVLDLRSSAPVRAGLSGYVKVAGVSQHLPFRTAEATLFAGSRRIPLQLSTRTLQQLRVFRREHRQLSVWLTVSPRGVQPGSSSLHVHEWLD
jgi:DNA-binding beta-propeller fold protein YncE